MHKMTNKRSIVKYWLVEQMLNKLFCYKAKALQVTGL